MAIEGAALRIVGLTADEAVGHAARLQEIYREAVAGAGPRHYDAAHVAAWASSADDVARWAVWLREGTTWIADDGRGRPLAFATTWPADRIHQLYVDPAWQRRGVAAALLAVVEDASREAGIATLSTDASLLAETVFAARGYALLAREMAPFGGHVFSRARMRKILS